MKRKTKIVLGLGVLAALCVTAGACGRGETLIEKKRKEGYVIDVTYHANGGNFLQTDGVTVVDMFRPTDYTADAEGVVHIKLREPDDSSRPTGSTVTTMSVTRQDHFFAGWYQERTALTNENGAVVDEEGNELIYVDYEDCYYNAEEYKTLVNGKLPDGKDIEEVTPAYEYDKYWDFANDTVDYSKELYAESNGVCSITLYAGWVPYYEFHYFYQDGGEWKQLDDVTSFDYKTTNNNPAKADKDTIWTPDWSDGAMLHTRKYMDGSTFTFPKVPDTTFKAAYTDEACTQRIEGSFEHPGTLDVEHGSAVNRIQNIYLELDEGEQYRITKPEQLIDNANPKGYYTIYADLDFGAEANGGAALEWPGVFSQGAFTGRLVSDNGTVRKLKNISGAQASGAIGGGVFGSVAKGAVIEDIAFEDITFDLKTGSRELYSRYGLFAGRVEDGATVENVSVSGGTFKIGKISLGEDYRLSLLCDDERSATAPVITQTGKVALIIYGERGIKDLDETGQEIYAYYYSVKTDTVKVENGVIKIDVISEEEMRDEAYVPIEY